MHDAARFEGRLADFLADPEDRLAAGAVLDASAEPLYALQLFAAACRVRDAVLGRRLVWAAGLTGVLPCTLTPHCRYCGIYNPERPPLEDIVAAARVIAGLGLTRLQLSGGTRLEGYDAEALDMVRAVRAACDLELEINLGPSLSRQGVRDLMAAGVVTVASSLEVFDPAMFARYKPGDSRERRIELLHIVEEEGADLKSIMLVGLGESNRERLELLYFLRQFGRMRELRLSRHRPVLAGERCSPWETARLVAMARILMPRVNIGLGGAGSGPDDLPLCLAAGGGNRVGGAMASLLVRQGTAGPGIFCIPINQRVTVINRMPLVADSLRGMGLQAYVN